MKAEELTKKIHDNCPIVWSKIKEKYTKILKELCEITLDEHYDIPDEIIFNIIFGLLEYFFEKNGIIININHFLISSNNKTHGKGICYILKDKNYAIIYDELIQIDKYYNNCDEAKYSAALKASEILEEQLNIKEKR